MGGRGANSGTGFVVKGFPPDLLQKEYKKHRQEFPENITPIDYNNRAKKLLSTPLEKHIKGFTSDKGQVYRYNTKTNELGVCGAGGSIITFFKPEEEIEECINCDKMPLFEDGLFATCKLCKYSDTELQNEHALEDNMGSDDQIDSNKTKKASHYREYLSPLMRGAIAGQKN